MAGFRSSNGYLGYGFQFVKATGVPPSTFVRLSAEESVEQVQEIYEERSLNGDRELDVMLKTAHKPQGSFSTLLRPGNGAELLAYALGSDSVSHGVTVHTHTITRGNTLPWISFERYLDSVERFTDSKINQVVINGTSGQPVSIDVNFMACDSSIQTAAWTASYETDEPFMFHDGSYTLDSGSVTTVSAFTITINNNLEGIQTTSYKLNDILEGPFSLDVTMRLKFEASESQYAAVLFGGSTTLVDTLDSGDLTIELDYGTGETEREIKFEIPVLKHKSITKHLDPNTKAVYLDLTSTAYKSASEIITVTAINDKASDLVSPSASTSPSASLSPSSSASASESPTSSPSASISSSPSA